MNVSQLMRSLIGDLRASDAKTLDLKVGEIVKGTVLKLLANQEALININGLSVKAKLEAPLSQGQMTMLQVQPETNQGQLVLKPLGSSQVQIANESLADLLKNFGLKDQLAGRQLIQHMHQEGIPLTKENVNRLAPLLTRIPEHIPSNQWIQSGILGMQRGLPLTEQTLMALHQVLFGKPMDQVSKQLQIQVNSWIQANPESGSSPTYRSIIQLQDGLQQILSSTAVKGGNAVSSHTTSSINTPVPNATAPNQTIQQIVNPSVTADPVGRHAVLASNLSLPENVARPPEMTLRLQEQVMQLKPASPTSALIAQPPNQSISNTTASANTNVLQGDHEQRNTNQQPIHVSVNSTMASSSEAGVPRVASDQTWISNILKLLGIEHEQQTAKLTGKPDIFNERLNFEKQFSGKVDGLLHDRIQADIVRQAQATPWDSIKSVIMQMRLMEELPPALRENAQQLLQHITGQQLFMTADRSSHFSHLTLFFPLLDEDGDQTAAINIQSRKGKHGEIDAENCRMLFDLNMNSLGNTLIDVQVTNKIISLQVHNDHPFISQLLEEGRESISEALHKVGYQLSSVKSVPYPEPSNSSEKANINPNVNAAKSSLYSAKPYKGMDVRV